MSFSAEWLSLREPADHAALNADVRQALRRRFEGRDAIAVVDLGCGAGSNLRGTWAALPARQSWTLVDYDARLLAAAREKLIEWADAASISGDALSLRKGSATLEVSFRQVDLSGGNFAGVTEGADLVTAAALFDLVSPSGIEALAASLAARGQTFFTVLTYDGEASWRPSHPADSAILAAFNAHQTSDKGFGPAAGPGATDALAKAFHRRGYGVLRGASPWLLDRSFARLRAELDRGFANAALETGLVPSGDVSAWLAHRLAGGERLSIIGHEDLLATPE
ncbi:MAG: class I SAM-dependent methyltransferase [Methylocystis sp.]|nr:class I SAM-dependent methyltransferase [Methylocystis sp.]MCA3583496.1 class I SAM-dependent methyltransferase [Methylocystis sp.]MCA3587118.1 class I SAM-dependent methyltransferase [Methylocystis sp.]MCA3592791.1 class I SAM-dependent methyltransferase [Methylocystis sp.]